LKNGKEKWMPIGAGRRSKKANGDERLAQQQTNRKSLPRDNPAQASSTTRSTSQALPGAARLSLLHTVIGCCGDVFFYIDGCELIKPKAVIRMHYGTNPWLVGTPAEFSKALGASAIKVLAIQPGEMLEF
jgi:hypothetical protein